MKELIGIILVATVLWVSYGLILSWANQHRETVEKIETKYGSNSYEVLQYYKSL